MSYTREYYQKRVNSAMAQIHTLDQRLEQLIKEQDHVLAAYQAQRQAITTYGTELALVRKQVTYLHEANEKLIETVEAHGIKII